MTYEAFSNAAIEMLDYYVYYLRDPRTNEIFYVGKGLRNRLFAHLTEALDQQERTTAKLDRIREIHALGLTVDHVIHRHGLTEKEAFEVEAALIDCIGIDLLTNAVGGHHSTQRGPMTIAEAFINYDAKHVEITHPGVVLNIHQLFQRSMTAGEIYEATRGDWVMGHHKREQVIYAFAVFDGIIREVYRVDEWTDITHARDGQPYNSVRWRFSGVVADEAIRKKYIRGDASYYVGQNPVRYVNIT